jgi:hypothetical protein
MGVSFALERDIPVRVTPMAEQLRYPPGNIEQVEKEIQHFSHLCRVDGFVPECRCRKLFPFPSEDNTKQVDCLKPFDRYNRIVNYPHID